MIIRGGCWLVLLSLFITDTQLSIQIAPPCSNEQHYEHAGRCCTKCGPGMYMSAKCTAISETICQPCGTNEYMDTWNEEEKCFLQKICDQGKALIEVNPGNSSFQRQCACTAGYHLNEDCDCCRRNTKCTPGFGVKHPIQEDKDTVCVECLTGYFSDTSSATDECKPWTNCTALGTEEKNPGTKWSDAVCKKNLKMHSKDETNKLLYMLVAPLLLVAFVGIAVLAIYYHNKGKVLTADLHYWANEICKQLKGTKDSSGDTFVNTNVESPAGLRLSEGTYLLDLDEYSFCEDMRCPKGHILCGEVGQDTIHYELGEDFPTLPLITKTEGDHFRQIPMEDEYTDRMPQGPSYIPLVNQSGSTPVTLFSEPMEVGENDSISQCFTGTESVVDLSNCCSSDLSCGTDPIDAYSDKCLQNSCYRCNTRDAATQDRGCFLGLGEETNYCTACGMPCTESSRKPENATDSLKESDPTPVCTCELDSSTGEKNASASNTGTRREPSDGNDTTHQNTKTTSEAKRNSSDPPAASGNVSGYGNSTFISSGQVMNFKGEIIVVYVSQNSQEGSTSSGATDDNLGSPVQEENLNRCETFVGNAHQYKEKCAEVNSYDSIKNEEPSTVGEYKRTSGPVVQEENQDCQNKKHFCNEASQPVQEEGKPGWFLDKVLY
ncbi:tumor necrosis factor receptor superfamily member 11A [Tiliqua scincoides]|uniref:tumor necrosis factor receptor superfamily member 11A n=1 Tax=Tiliqua scincoides TaxID=71010 RepID=UPI0034619124